MKAGCRRRGRADRAVGDDRAGAGRRLATLMGRATGSAQAVQGIFPLLFVTMFLSSAQPAARPDRGRLVPGDRDLQPDQLPGRGPAHPDHHRLGRGGAGHGFALLDRHRVVAFGPSGWPCGRGWRGHERGRACCARTSRSPRRSRGASCATRSTTRRWRSRRSSSPLFFLVASRAACRRWATCPGFAFESGYTAFQYIFVFLQSSAFTGIFTGFGVAADWENGFARRLLLAAPYRLGMLLGYALRRRAALDRERRARHRGASLARDGGQRQPGDDRRAGRPGADRQLRGRRCGASASRCGSNRSRRGR